MGSRRPAEPAGRDRSSAPRTGSRSPGGCPTGLDGTATVPGESALSYYANDLVRQQLLGDQRQTWALDATRRLGSWTVESNASGTWQTTATKLNHW